MACLELIKEYSSYIVNIVELTSGYLSCGIYDFTCILLISPLESFAKRIFNCWVVTLVKATINKLTRQ